MDIYEVKVCKFISEEQNDNVCRLKRGEVITHYCVIDFKQLLAKDIFTGEEFRILRKNYMDQILPFEDVKLNQDYVIYHERLRFDKLSKRQLIKIKFACFKLSLLNRFNQNGLSTQKQNIIKR